MDPIYNPVKELNLTRVKQPFFPHGYPVCLYLRQRATSCGHWFPSWELREVKFVFQCLLVDCHVVRCYIFQRFCLWTSHLKVELLQIRSLWIGLTKDWKMSFYYLRYMKHNNWERVLRGLSQQTGMLVYVDLSKWIRDHGPAYLAL